MKEVRVIMSPEAKEVYKYLNEESINSKTERMILKSINQKIFLIKKNPQFGSPISKKLIPNEYKIRYNITNLFRVELPSYWRMLYSLEEGETKIEIIAFILDIMDHGAYNKKLGYKKK